MRYWPLLSIIWLASCCPKITEQTTVTKKSDTVTVYLTDTVLVPMVADTFTVDAKSLCDSLLNRKMIHFRDSISGVSVSINMDDRGTAHIVASCDSLELVIDSLRQITTITDTVFVDKITVVEKKAKRKSKFWLGFGLGAGAIILLVLALRFK